MRLFAGMLAVGFLWAGLWFTFLGLGLLVRRAFGLRTLRAEVLLASFWVGWALALIFLQLWNFLFPVDWRALLVVCGTGTVGMVLHSRRVWTVLAQGIRSKWVTVVMLLIVAVWLTNRAMAQPKAYDTGLYHVASVRWAASYPVVPGLVHLHDRLAFNSSYFLYGAMLEFWRFSHKASQVAAGLLILVLFAQVLLSWHRFFRARGDCARRDFFAMVLLGPTIALSFSMFNPSVAPEVPIFAIGVVVSIELLMLLGAPPSHRREFRHGVFFIALLTAVGITVKLSFVAFGVCALLASLWCLSRRARKQHERARGALISAILACWALALIPWMIRSVVLSGYPLYPSTVLACPVEWRASPEAVTDTANWIRSWARQPGRHWSEVLGNWRWFKPWLGSMLEQHKFEIALPFLLTALGLLVLTLYRGEPEGEPKNVATEWLFLLPAAVGLVFWFAMAPGWRFAGSLPWVLGAGVFTLAAARAENRPQLAVFGVALLLLAGWLLDNQNALRKSLIVQAIPGTTFHPLPRVAFREFRTRSGLILYTPVEGNQCWDGPLLSTAYPKHLRLRDPNDIGRGFMLDRPE